jgi:hypothetical protein
MLEQQNPEMHRPRVLDSKEGARAACRFEEITVKMRKGWVGEISWLLYPRVE